MIRTLTARATATVRTTASHAWRRLREQSGNDDGYTTETVIVTALLIICAIAVVGIITAKIIDKANSLNF